MIGEGKMEDEQDVPEIIATWSPCCRILREGKREPGVVHDGLCRGRNGGNLGPTVFLVALKDSAD